MSVSSSQSSDPKRERSIAILTQLAALVYARETGQYLKAAAAHHELEKLGIRVHFLRRPKAEAAKGGET